MAHQMIFQKKINERRILEVLWVVQFLLKFLCRNDLVGNLITSEAAVCIFASVNKLNVEVSLHYDGGSSKFSYCSVAFTHLIKNVVSVIISLGLAPMTHT